MQQRVTLRQVCAGVTAGLTLHWSKKIKRQLYGRARFELLRKLILLQ
ncbi:hypothetical protein ABZT03_42105 [Streptomyces sp. NPDC005574]